MHCHVQREQDNKAQMTGTYSCPLSLRNTNIQNLIENPIRFVVIITRGLRLCVWRAINQSINQSISLIATLRPDSRIANDMQLK